MQNAVKKRQGKILAILPHSVKMTIFKMAKLRKSCVFEAVKFFVWRWRFFVCSLSGGYLVGVKFAFSDAQNNIY